MKKSYLFLFIILGLHLLFLTKLQFTAWPETFSFPYFISKGFLPYKDFVHAYPPLLIYILSFIYRIFGYKSLVLSVFTWIMVLLNDFLVFLIIGKITKNFKFSLLGLLFYILTQPFLDGNMLWFDTAVTTPMLLGIYFAIGGIESKSKKLRDLFFVGLFLILAFFTKQTALVFIFIFLTFLIFTKAGFKKVTIFFVPVFLFSGLFLLWLLKNNNLVDFYNWTIYYPFAYWSKYPTYVNMTLSRREIFILLLLLAPATALFFRKLSELIKDKSLLLLYAFLLGGILAVYPRFSFYHFQPALAIAAILFGCHLKYLKVRVVIFVSYSLLLIIFIVIPVVRMDWGKEIRFWSKEDIALSYEIGRRVPEGKRIYLLGLHSGLYTLSNRLPEKPWIDNFGWYFEIPGVQEEVVESWRKNPPKAIFIQDQIPGEWYLLGTYQPPKILEWIKLNYIKKEEIRSGVWFWELKNRK